ncbi:MAG: hypothetical protein II885_11745 [Oscillospiraceae bacterium]|jgi:hypothetical protein|nr:hypothetical protein [Oscillospiraceae bacterium]
MTAKVILLSFLYVGKDQAADEENSAHFLRRRLNLISFLCPFDRIRQSFFKKSAESGKIGLKSG